MSSPGLYVESPSMAAFWVAFLTTVVLLVVALVTGFLRRRRLHLVVAPVTVVALAVTVVLTEQLVQRYDFPDEALQLHLALAKVGGLLVLPVVATGLWLWRRPRARLWHRGCVLVWLVAVLAATGTGIWIFTLGTLKTA